MAGMPNGAAPPSTPAQVLEHVEDLSRWCRKKSADRHLAEDVVQQTVLEALRALARVQYPRHLRGWMFRVAQRRFVDAHRLSRGELPLTCEPPAPDRNGADAVRREEAQLEVSRLLRRLPVFLRKPVRLHYLKGYPLREVAARLGSTVNGIKSRLYRARRLLRGERPK
ncbi:MAG: RNA polymerase sigma factor [Planctomycetota bacterium]|nr:RNA polymerase sigma factor [Planctomycetota bacterium]